MAEPGPILVALESSKADLALLEMARAYARAFSARLYLVHVAPPEPDFVGLPKAEMPPDPGDAEVGYAYDRKIAAERAKAAHADLEARRAEMEAAGIPATALLIEGVTADKILAEATRLDAGLIIVGSHQRGTLGRWLHGSTSREVLHTTPCPVLVVPVSG